MLEKAKSPDDPNRCQAVTKKGQCINKKAEGSNFCAGHGGTSSGKDKAMNNYRLTKFQAKLERHSSSTTIKSLRDEVAILRMIVEEKMNSCEDINDLMLISQPISDLVLKIDKVVNSCHKLDNSMGQLLDKSAILQFASEVINIIDAEVKDEKILNKIANKIMASLGTNDETS